VLVPGKIHLSNDADLNQITNVMNAMLNVASAVAEAPRPSAEMLDREAEKIVNDMGIPPCPAILTKLLRQSREDEPDFGLIGSLIGSDVSLAAAMLKTVNSPFYGLGRKATSIQQALVLLGLQNVTRLITGLLLRQVFAVSNRASMESFWSLSSRIAAITAHLARALRCADRDEAYTFGLFRDCGMPLMACKYADYADLLDSDGLSHGSALLVVEEERYAVNHALVGSHMASSWHLSAELCQAIQHHHAPDVLARHGEPALGRGLVALGMLAERIDALSADDAAAPDADWRLAGEQVLSCLGITEQDLPRLLAGVAAMEA